jgi:beta-N-acetylhexosaminidase
MYRPSTISYNVITGLLKEEMNFDGVVVSDAVDMGALKTIFADREDLYAALLNAGIDVVLGVSDIDYIDVVESAVKKGKIPMARIDDACERILRVKEKMGFFEEQDEVEMTKELKSEIEQYCYDVAENALCLQCNNNNLLPLDPEKIKSVAILCFSHTDYFSESLNAMKTEFEKRGIKVRLQRRIASYEEMQEIADENDLIIYAAFVAPHAPMGGSGLFCEECRALFYAHTAGREKSLGVSMHSPYVYYDYFANMDTYIHTFSRSRETQQAFVKALFGEIPFNGVYPYEKPWEDGIVY